MFLAKKVPHNLLLRHPLIFAALPQVHEAGTTAVYLCEYPSPFFVLTDTPFTQVNSRTNHCSHSIQTLNGTLRWHAHPMCSVISYHMCPASHTAGWRLPINVFSTHCRLLGRNVKLPATMKYARGAAVVACSLNTLQKRQPTVSPI